MNNKNLTVLVLALVLLASLLLPACAKPAPAPAPTPAPTTQRIVITYSSTTMTQIGTGSIANTPSPGSIYLVLDMTIQNQGYDSFSINPVFFSIVVNNVKYSMAFIMGLDNQLKLVDILNGGTTQGKLAFEVPSQVTTTGFQVTYSAFEPYNIQWVKQ